MVKEPVNSDFKLNLQYSIYTGFYLCLIKCLPFQACFIQTSSSPALKISMYNSPSLAAVLKPAASEHNLLQICISRPHRPEVLTQVGVRSGH